MISISTAANNFADKSIDEIMNESFEISAEISSGKKTFNVKSENGGYSLIESGSIAALIKQKNGRWTFTTGSYTEQDAQIIGKLIDNRKSD